MKNLKLLSGAKLFYAVALLLGGVTVSCASPPTTNNAPVPQPVPVAVETFNVTSPADGMTTHIWFLGGYFSGTNWNTVEIDPVFNPGSLLSSATYSNTFDFITSFGSNSVSGAISPFSNIFTNQAQLAAHIHNAGLVSPPQNLH